MDHELPRLISEASGAPARPVDFASVASEGRGDRSEVGGVSGGARLLPRRAEGAGDSLEQHARSCHPLCMAKGNLFDLIRAIAIAPEIMTG